MEDRAKRIDIDGKSARYYAPKPHDSSGTDHRIPAHFYGGNGFATGVYLPLLTALGDDFSLTALAMQGCWYDVPNASRITREQDAAALITFLEKTQAAPIVGIGHSQGATATAIAAARRPDLFSRLYLIEPVTFTKAQALLYDLLPRRLKLTREPFKSTLNKPSQWQSIDAYYEHLRRLRAYRRISDEHLQLFAAQSVRPTAGGQYELLFSPDQELANYFGTPFIDDALKTLNKNGTPYTLITGKPTLFISDKVRANWEKFVPKSRLISLPDYGHLLPIEAPKRCADIIMDLEVSRSDPLS